MTSPVLETQETGEEPWMLRLLPWLPGGGKWGGRGRADGLSPTAVTNVWLEEVPASTSPRWKVAIDKIEVTHRAIPSWGLTTANAVISHTPLQGKDGRYRIRLTATTLNLDIALRPKSQFGTIEEFAPFYREFIEDYKGDRVTFCRAKGMRLDEAYNDFATVEGVLYHELTHGVVAARSAAIRWRKLLGALSGGSGFDSVKSAEADLREHVSRIWHGFRGQLVHGDVMMDEVYVWEKECAWYIKAYEQWLKQNGGR